MLEIDFILNNISLIFYRVTFLFDNNTVLSHLEFYQMLSFQVFIKKYCYKKLKYKEIEFNYVLLKLKCRIYIF